MRHSAKPKKLRRLERTQLIRRPIEHVFPFFADAGNLEALTPPFLRFRILTPPPIEMAVGTQIEYAIVLFGIPVRWRTRITAWEPGDHFIDEQESGPYAVWRHLHQFEARGDSVLMRDVVDYREPFGPLGTVANALFVGRTLDRIFDFREQAVHALLER
jgi:ligand-binding SRPBCC domain-containing protein